MRQPPFRFASLALGAVVLAGCTLEIAPGGLIPPQTPPPRKASAPPIAATSVPEPAETQAPPSTPKPSITPTAGRSTPPSARPGGPAGPPPPTNAPRGQAAAPIDFGEGVVAWAAASTPAGIFVASNFTNEVLKLGTDGTATRVAGTGKDGIGDVAGQKALVSHVRQPMGLGADAEGRLLIFEVGGVNGAYQVLRLEADGTLSRRWALDSQAAWFKNRVITGMFADRAGEPMLKVWDTTRAKPGANDVSDYEVWAVPAQGGELKLVREDDQTALVVAGMDDQGRLYFQRQNSAQRQIDRFDPQTGERTTLLDSSNASFMIADQRGNVLYTSGEPGKRQLNLWRPDGSTVAIAAPFNELDQGFVPMGQNQHGGVAPDGTVYVIADGKAWLFPEAVPTP